MSAKLAALVAIALYAVRAVSPPGFRRGGVYFPSEAWTICEPTPEQLAEPRLVCVPADGSVGFARQIGPLPILNEELLPEPVTNPSDPEVIAELQRQLAACSEMHAVRDSQIAIKEARIAELESENFHLRGEIELTSKSVVSGAKADDPSAFTKNTKASGA